ncbi:MAG: neutral zinc metallopeptidase, partial [Exiguobacterium oxidotolerans]
AHHAQGENLLEEGDLEEALGAANAVGDDTLQKKGQGYVVPESFTHGTSKQRKSWFQKGFDNGTIEGGDTFKAANL